MYEIPEKITELKIVDFIKNLKIEILSTKTLDQLLDVFKKYNIDGQILYDFKRNEDEYDFSIFFDYNNIIVDSFENVVYELGLLFKKLNYTIHYQNKILYNENENKHEVIFYFPHINEYLGTNGYFWSDGRTDFNNLYKVKQIIKTTIIWEPLEKLNDE